LDQPIESLHIEASSGLSDLVVREIWARGQDDLGYDDSAQVGPHPGGKHRYLYLPGTVVCPTCCRSTLIVGALALSEEEAWTSWMHLVALYIGREPTFTAARAGTAGSVINNG
jgi:hypothetical protein